MPSVLEQSPANRLVPLLLLGLFFLAALSLATVALMYRATRRKPATVAIKPTLVEAGPIASTPPALERTDLPAAPGVWLELAADTTRRFALDELPFTIGRAAGSELMVDETFPEWQTVSREHAIITRHPRGYLIADRGSCNGLRVNGRLTPKNLLRDGCQVTLGGVNFRFVDRTKPS